MKKNYLIALFMAFALVLTMITAMPLNDVLAGGENAHVTSQSELVHELESPVNHTVFLDSDIICNGSINVVGNSQILDLNGHTLTLYGTIYLTGDTCPGLTVKGSGTDSKFKSVGNEPGFVVGDKNQTSMYSLTIKSGDFENNSDEPLIVINPNKYYTESDSGVVIDNGSFYGGGYNEAPIIDLKEGSDDSMNAVMGKLEVNSGSMFNKDGPCINGGDHNIVKINSGSFINQGGYEDIKDKAIYALNLVDEVNSIMNYTVEKCYKDGESFDGRYDRDSDGNLIYDSGGNPISLSQNYISRTDLGRHKKVQCGSSFSFGQVIIENDDTKGEIKYAGDEAYISKYGVYFEPVGKTGYRAKYINKKDGSSYIDTGFTSYLLYAMPDSPRITFKVTYEPIPSISDTTVKTDKTTYAYTGNPIKPNVTVVDLISGKDYTVSYYNNVKVGKAKAVAYGANNRCSGSKTVYYTIIPKKSAISKTYAGKRYAAVKMSTKVASTGASAYQVKYRIKGTKKWKAVATKSQSLKIKKLKKGKKYQIVARAYKKVDGKTYYGGYSKIVTTKKIK